MNDKDVVERCAKLLGTKVSTLRKREEHHGVTYRCTVRGTGAINWMKRLYPYMCSRRQAKIREIVAAWESTPMLKSPVMKRSVSEGFSHELGIELGEPKLLEMPIHDARIHIT